MRFGRTAALAIGLLLSLLLGEVLVRALGPPKLDLATIEGSRVFSSGTGLPREVRLQTIVRHVLGQHSAQEVVSNDKTENVITRSSE